jgi:hypothetical protein
VAVGEEAVMGDTTKAVRQGVEQEAEDELTGADGEKLRLAMVAIVHMTEGDVGVCHADQTRIGYRDAMRESAEISQRLSGSAEGRLGIDHPVNLAKLAEPGREGDGLCEVVEFPEEAEIAILEGGALLVEEQPAEETPEHANRQEEAGPAGDPARALERRAATRHNAVDMRMVMQVLDPGTDHGDEADLGAEMFRFSGEPVRCLGRRPEQDGVDRLLVMERGLGDRRQQREHDMGMRHRQQLGLPSGQPIGARLPLPLRAISELA